MQLKPDIPGLFIAAVLLLLHGYLQLLDRLQTWIYGCRLEYMSGRSVVAFLMGEKLNNLQLCRVGKDV